MEGGVTQYFLYETLIKIINNQVREKNLHNPNLFHTFAVVIKLDNHIFCMIESVWQNYDNNRSDARVAEEARLESV